MADYYRKSSLDKLSSPEQLDRAITIISPSFWVAAIGGGLIIAVVLIWSVFGRLPVSVSTIGMYMGDNGIYNAIHCSNSALLCTIIGNISYQKEMSIWILQAD